MIFWNAPVPSGDAGCKLAVHRYVAQSGLVTEFWWKQPNGRWLLKSYFDGFGTPAFLDGLVHA